MAEPRTTVAGMNVNVAGEGAPALVFVHGFACDSTDWAAQFDSLSQQTTVVSCDLRSHGQSAGEIRDCSIQAYGAAVADMVEDLRLPAVILVGHSMGCRVVLECYRTAPDLVAGIVLLDGSRIGVGDSIAAGRAMAARLEGDGYDSFVREFFEAMFVPSSDPTLRSAIVERALRLPAAMGRPLLIRLVEWDAADMEDAFAAVRVPVLVIQTTALNLERERVSIAPGTSSSWLDLVRSGLPTARVETIPDAGHFPHIERADDVTALIADFLAQVTGGREAT